MSRIPSLLVAALLLGSALGVAAPTLGQRYGPVHVDGDGPTATVDGYGVDDPSKCSLDGPGCLVVPQAGRFTPDQDPTNLIYPGVLIDYVNTWPGTDVAKPLVRDVSDAANSLTGEASLENLNRIRNQALRVGANPADTVCGRAPSVPLLTVDATEGSNEIYDATEVNGDVVDIRITGVVAGEIHYAVYQPTETMDLPTSRYLFSIANSSFVAESGARGSMAPELHDGVVTLESIPLLEGDWVVHDSDHEEVARFSVESNPDVRWPDLEDDLETENCDPGQAPDRLSWQEDSSAKADSPGTSRTPSEVALRTSTGENPSAGEPSVRMASSNGGHSNNDCSGGYIHELVLTDSHKVPEPTYQNYWQEWNETGEDAEGLIFFQGYSYDVHVTIPDADGSGQCPRDTIEELHNALGVWYAVRGPTEGVADPNDFWEIYVGGHGNSFQWEHRGETHRTGIELGQPQHAIQSDDNESVAMRYIPPAKYNGWRMPCESREDFDLFMYGTTGALLTAAALYGKAQGFTGADFLGQTGLRAVTDAIDRNADPGCTETRWDVRKNKWGPPKWREKDCNEVCFVSNVYGYEKTTIKGFEGQWLTHTENGGRTDVGVSLAWDSVHLDDVVIDSNGHAKAESQGRSYDVENAGVTVNIGYEHS